MYVGLFEDNNQLFLCWRNNKGNKVYTNIDFISVERLSNNGQYDSQKYSNILWGLYFSSRKVRGYYAEKPTTDFKLQ